MKRGISIITLAFFIIAFTGCSVKVSETTPMTAKEFKTEMEEKGLSVVDQIDSANGDSSYQDIYVATDGDKYSFEYYFMTDPESAKNVFTTATETLDANYKDDSSAVIIANSTDESGKYEVTASDYYCVVCQNQNTVLYLTSNIAYKDEAQDILKDLGY